MEEGCPHRRWRWLLAGLVRHLRDHRRGDHRPCMKEEHEMLCLIDWLVKSSS